MEERKEVTEEEVNYEAIKLKRKRIDRNAQIIALIGNILVVVSMMFSRYYSEIFWILLSITVGVLTFGAILALWAYRMRPLCPKCERKMIFRDDPGRFYCKWCKKYY